MQLLIVPSLYISILTSSTNLMKLIPFLSCVHALINSELENRNRIDDIKKPHEISVSMLNDNDSYSDS